MDLRSILRLRPLRRALVKARWVSGRCFMRLCHGVAGVKPNRIYFSSFCKSHESGQILFHSGKSEAAIIPVFVVFFIIF